MLDFRNSKKTGIFLYYLLWPLVWIYAPLFVRVRVLLVVYVEVAVVKIWFGPNSWQLPGGGVKKNEKVALAATREIREELGYQMDASTLQRLTQKPLLLSSGGIFYRYHYVLYKLDKKPTLSVSHGITDTNWVGLSSLSMPKAIHSRAL